MEINDSTDRPDIISPFNWAESAELNLRSLKMLEDGRVAVFVSPNFRKSLRLLVDELMKQLARPVPGQERSERMQTHVRKLYQDVCLQLVGRIRKDLSGDEISFLHFGLVKSVMTVIAEGYRDFVISRRQMADELKKSGEGELLRVQDHLIWLNRNPDLVMYRILKPIMNELKRMTTRDLEDGWNQISKISLNSPQILFSPIMQCPDFRAPHFLLENFYLWEGEEGNKLNKVGIALEDIFSRYLPELAITTFDPPSKVSTAGKPMIGTDGSVELNFSYAGQQVLRDNAINETFCWLDNPDIVSELFNLDNHKAAVKELVMEREFSKAWQTRKQYRRIRKALDKVSDFLYDDDLLTASAASRKLNELWPDQINYHIDFRLLYKFLVGDISFSQMTSSIPQQYELNSYEVSLLKEARREMLLNTREEENKCSYTLLQLLADYRRNLKYYRIASNLFNKVRLIDEDEAKPLQENGEPFYSLLTANEITEIQNTSIANHCILNMGLRGVTSLKSSIKTSGKNPEEYLNTNFFNVIQEMVGKYDANIVMLKNTKLVVSFHEYVDRHEDWSAVGSACDLAQKLMALISRFNAHNSALGLPDLGGSIGIAFEENLQRTREDRENLELYNLDAFTTAELLSHSTESDVPPDVLQHFNAHVSTGKEYFLNISREQKSMDLLGHQTMQNTVYNYNGILLASKAFEKLNTENSLHGLTVALGDRKYSFFFTPYALGEHASEFWLREGKSYQVTKDGVRRPIAGSTYYELVQNPDTIKVAREVISRQVRY